MKSQKKINTEKQWLLFYNIMNARSTEENIHVSEISGKKLYGEINSCWFHHILPKSKYPELRYCMANIIMLTTEEHDAVERGQYFKEVEDRKIALQEDYDYYVEETKKYVEEVLNPIYEHAVKNTAFFKQNQH